VANGPATERNSMAYGEQPDERRAPGGARWCRWAGAGGAKSGRPADVAMMQATNFGDLDDHAEFWPLDWPRVGCILVEREVSSGPVIVREVVREDAAQVPVAQDAHFGHRDAMYAKDNRDPEGGQAWGSSV